MTLPELLHTLALRLDALETQSLREHGSAEVGREHRVIAGAEAQVYGKLRIEVLRLMDGHAGTPATPRPMRPPEPRPPIVTRTGPGDTTLSGFFALMSRRFPELGRSAAPVRFTCDGHPVTLESVAVAEDGVTVNLTGLETGREPWGAS